MAAHPIEVIIDCSSHQILLLDKKPSQSDELREPRDQGEETSENITLSAESGTIINKREKKRKETKDVYNKKAQCYILR